MKSMKFVDRNYLYLILLTINMIFSSSQPIKFGNSINEKAIESCFLNKPSRDN